MIVVSYYEWLIRTDYFPVISIWDPLNKIITNSETLIDTDIHSLQLQHGHLNLYGFSPAE